MDDNQKWLLAAAGLEEDIRYLKAASLTGLEKDIQQLRMALAVYKKNAATGVAWPSPDDLYCIQALPYGARVATATRRDFKTA
ncbi:MAG TPA: hypothetical protein VFB79_20940 [Candidatus Angelobacter sp.]|nr:hypothetical protein [Candidatus Angelobacter sp.]